MKTNMTRRSIALVAMCVAVAVLSVVSVASAHDTWIIARGHDERGNVGLHVTSGMDFPRDEVGPKPERVEGAGWRLGDRTGTFTKFQAGDSSLVINAHFEYAGTAVAWIAFKPRAIDLDNAEVEEYLDEIGAPERLRRTWESAGPDRKWHEVYAKTAKTFVHVGDDGEDPSCIPALGAAIELVPLRDPTVLAAGDSIVVRVLKKGYPVEGQPVGAVCGKDGSSTIKYSNKSGHVAFQLTRGGPWLLRATELRLQTDGSWTSDFTTMTFSARE